MEVMEEYTLEECTVWMEGLDLCRNCPDEREGNTVHPDGYGCYIKRLLPTRCPMNDRDKMREEIAKSGLPLRNKIVLLLADANTSEPRLTYYDVSVSILSLLAPVVEKATFLDDIIKRTDDKDCYENGWCPLSDTCDGKLWCRHIKEALEAPDGN